ncbi:hypothetical protein Glove_99g284 [Diversispora epigaea]|uniref:Copper acquisition factor BIM1-like domain-containing protein n=1 Tax=Diversispora epigaea TaxID=1348612 RepID=A0A397J489_9GLOM|nr:hypothetical protein Glove_99g284 [Diversispora epigaea]
MIYNMKIRQILFFVFIYMFVIEINAHFNFYKPPYRGTDLPYNVKGYPCGGYNQVNNSLITTVTLKTDVSVELGHGNGTFSFSFSPTTDGTFISISDEIYADAEAGAISVNSTVDLSKAKGTNGMQGVIQVVYKSGGNTSYQCADVLIKDNSTTTTIIPPTISPPTFSPTLINSGSSAVPHVALTFLFISLTMTLIGNLVSL